MSDQEEPGPSGYSRTSARVTAPSNPNSDTNLIIRALVFKRAAVKRKITGTFKKLDGCSTLANKQAGIAVVNSLLDQISNLDTDINDAYFQACNAEFDLSETYERELDGQTDYAVDVRARLTDLSPNSANKPLVEQTGIASNCKLKLPDLKCESFSGEGVNNLQFHAFQTKFDNIIGNRSDISNSTKFTYLTSYLKGYALKLIQHLQVTDDNYIVAIQMLKAEFLNKGAVTNDLIKKLLEIKPKYEINYLETKIYINEVRCIISDLKNYDVDLIADASAHTLASHIVFNKLPSPFRQQDQVTTKVRVFLSCSLKVDDNPSLNEPSYPGINLINDLMKLLITL